MMTANISPNIKSILFFTVFLPSIFIFSLLPLLLRKICTPDTGPRRILQLLQRHHLLHLFHLLHLVGHVVYRSLYHRCDVECSGLVVYLGGDYQNFHEVVVLFGGFGEDRS